MHILAPLSPAIALAFAILLFNLIRHRLHRHGPAQESVALTVTAPPGDRWQRINARSNGWVTAVLPVIVGAAILALATWLLAYLGWAAAYVTHQSIAEVSAPPWFGNIAVLIVDAALGGVTAISLALFSGGFIGIACLVGRCTLWPEVCHLCDQKPRKLGDPENKN